MQNLICGRKPTFGDVEQIRAVKEERARLRKLEEAEKLFYDEHPDGDIQSTNCILISK